MPPDCDDPYGCGHWRDDFEVERMFTVLSFHWSVVMTTYLMIPNCNFESRDDDTGRAIHQARQAVESGLTDDASLVAALDALEETLRNHADDGCMDAVEACRDAEQAVAAAWTPATQDAVEEARVARYVD
jgi:hypothetical protein